MNPAKVLPQKIVPITSVLQYYCKRLCFMLVYI